MPQPLQENILTITVERNVMTTAEAPHPVRHKTFFYTTKLEWLAGRTGRADSEGKVGIEISSPPEFKGERGKWTPEDLFVEAVEACFMTTFMALASRKGIPILSYSSTATGTLEFVDGAYRISRIVLMPRVTISDSCTEDLIRTILQDSHRQCLISNSIHSAIEVQPTITSGIND